MSKRKVQVMDENEVMVSDYAEPDYSNLPEEGDDAQSADITSSWIEGRMFRKPLESDDEDNEVYRVVIKNLHTGKVAADFVATVEPDGVRYVDAIALTSRIGERAQDRDFKGAGWMRPKDVSYNLLTHEAEIRQ